MRNLMLFRTKLFLILFFLPAWISSLLQWGDDRTSSGFAAAPLWFYRLQLTTQFVAILILFITPRLRPRPSIAVVFLSVATIVGLSIANPIIEAEFILLNASRIIALIAIFLAFAQPSAKFERSDIALLFYLFVGGFVLQIFLFLQFGIMPSHSISDLFIRFNGITNDSLATGFILSLLIPWAVSSRYAALKVPTIIAESLASGSLFAVVFVPLAVVGYMIYRRLYGFAFAIIALMAAAIAYFYDLFARIIEIKILSIETHLRFILNVSGISYQQSAISCSEEFCESFLESGLYLSLIYLVSFYALLLCFIIPLFRSERSKTGSPLIADTLRVYGAALVAGTFVHPVPLIPFAIPLFLILASLYLGNLSPENRSSRIGRGAKPVPT